MSDVDFALPDLGEGLTEAEVVRWLVAVGEQVGIDQPVVEVETAKATVEVPCPHAGTVTTLHAEPGQEVPVGAPLISVRTDAPAAQGDTRADDTSGPVLVGYGTPPPQSPGGAPSGARPQSPPEPSPVASAAGAGPAPVVSPLVRRSAREHGIDAAALRGSGDGGLVLRRDVDAAIAAQGAGDGVRGGARTPAGGSGAAAAEQDAERVALRGVQRTMAERLSRSRREIPEATVWVEVDATGLLAARTAINEADPEHPVGVLGLLARFCVLGLGRYPELNASVDAERGELVRHRPIHLGFAAQTPRGLMVPVVHDAQGLSARRLSAALAETKEQALAGTLDPRQLRGGTFTVNNYGMFGVDGSAPIINHPEAAMVGLGRIIRRPWVVDTPSGEEVRPRSITTLVLVFDHRVCDGATAGAFLRFVADCIERPQGLLGEV